MNVDTISNPGGQMPMGVNSTETIDSGRKMKNSGNIDGSQATDSTKVQPEEFLNNIKALTQDGLYSVRFEKDDLSSEMVVKIFDTASQEVIRQIPPEELMNFKATFADLVGNVVNTQG